MTIYTEYKLWAVSFFFFPLIAFDAIKLGHRFFFLFFFLFYRFFSQQVSVGGRNKNKNKIHSDHFPIELKSKETQFPSILIQLENGPNEFYFTN